MKFSKNLGLLFLVVIGFLFRYQGISQQLSYWNDESHTALMARNILWYGTTNPLWTITGIYQLALYYLTALAFKLGGITELAGRLPSVLAGTLLIAVVYWIAYQLFTCNRKAFIASFLVAFSQIQLAWSTQLRPYIWLELFTLVIVYYCYQSLKNRTRLIDKNLIISFFFTLIAALFHGTGLINLVLFGAIFSYKFIKLKKYHAISGIGFIIVLGLLLLSRSGVDLRDVLFNFDFNLLHYRIFITHRYWWLFLGASLGTIFLWKKKSELAIILSGSVLIIFAIVIFKVSSQYVRYSLPGFPLLYLLFSSGIVDLADLVKKKPSPFFQKTAFILLIVLSLAWPIKHSKIMLWPRYYYSINADMRENPIVDYKLAFTKIKDLIKNNPNTIVMDAWNDRVPWYLPGREFVFLKSEASRVGSGYGENLIGTIEQFEIEKIKYTSGVVIIEDWPSLTPPELQAHLRQTLKHEFDVQDLPYNENDHWGISVYSWGI